MEMSFNFQRIVRSAESALDNLILPEVKERMDKNRHKRSNDKDSSSSKEKNNDLKNDKFMGSDHQSQLKARQNKPQSNKGNKKKKKRQAKQSGDIDSGGSGTSVTGVPGTEGTIPGSKVAHLLTQTDDVTKGTRIEGTRGLHAFYTYSMSTGKSLP